MQRKVKIYSAPYCTFCLMAKNFLKKHGIEYEDINVQADEHAAREIYELTQQTTIPVIIVDDKEIIIGFDEEKLKMALKIKG
ncbi:MAG: glutaredoxin family protein [Candidatus Micrarchaeia archaeon]